MKRTARTILTALTLWLTAGCVLAQATTKPLSPAEEVEYKTFTSQLSDPARDVKTKLDAATLLLTRTYPQAAQALKDFLADGTNRAAQAAVAEAIARGGTDQKLFVDPLLALLTGTEATLREPAARALAACKNGGAMEKLIAVAGDKAIDRAVRLVAMSSLQRILDKQVVDALIGLLDDGDGQIRTAATDALTKLTNIRAFGQSRTQWKDWWRQNMNKDKSQWLVDLTDSLTQSKTALEAENARLRTRLAGTMMDLYAATPASSRDAMLISFLKDPLQDVRLVGLQLVSRGVVGGTAASADVRNQVRAMLADGDDHVRQEAAKLVATIGDAEALKVLMERLKAETSPPVRFSILIAMGQLRDPKAVPAVMAEIKSKDEDVAAAAATALGKIAAKASLDDATRKLAVAALNERSAQTTRNGPEIGLREALLAAMGDVNDKSFIPLLDAALKDDAATVRMAAVTSLSQLGATASLGSIEKLVSDSDRGVRGSAVVALKSLGGDKYLQTILLMTDPEVEKDAANRQQAWDIAMGMLAKADSKVLLDVLTKLGDRADAAAQRIKVIQLLASQQRDAGSADLPVTLGQLGAALGKAARPSEAAAAYAEAYTLLTTAKDAKAQDVWFQWVDALLAADDASVMKALADQQDKDYFAKAVKALDVHLDILGKKGNTQAVIVLTGECVKVLPARLSDQQKTQYQDLLNAAKKQQLTADKQKVGKLVSQLLSGDEAASKAAATELQTMGDRAIGPLVAELKTVVEAANQNSTAEQTLADMLRQIAPKLAGYDVAAPKDQRVKLVNSWVEKKSGE